MKKVLCCMSLIAAFAASAIEEPLKIYNLSTPVGIWWGGAQRTVAKGGPDGGKYVEVKATQIRGGGYLARSMQPLERKCFPLWGEKIEYTFYAKGKGTLKIGYRNTCARDTPSFAKGNPMLSQKILTQINLTEKWQKYTVDLTVTDPISYRGTTIYYENHGKDSYYCIANEIIQSKSPVPSGIKTVPPHMVTYPGEKTEVVFSAPKLKKVKAFDGKAVKELSSSNGVFKINTTNLVECDKINPGTKIIGVSRVGIWDSASGEYSGVYVNCIPKKEWDIYNNTAKKIKLSKPLNILFLGDSLSDYDRTRNYTDKVAFWLNKYNPGKCTYLNAGVGGDMIEYVHDRLTNGPCTFRRNMYKGIMDQKWDMIFIFVGHNDTRQHYNSRYGKDGHYQGLTPVKQKKFWEQTLAYLKKKTQAKIVIITPCSSDVKQSIKGTESARKAKREYVIFGEEKPLEEFCAIEKAAAKKYGVEVIDIYTPMKALGDKKSVFFTIPDGVHLTSPGNNYIAGEILKYFAAKYK